MIRCPACDANESTLVERVHFDDGRAADRRECVACGEQWMAPAPPQPGLDDVETIELRGDTAADAPTDEGIEDWFR